MIPRTRFWLTPECRLLFTNPGSSTTAMPTWKREAQDIFATPSTMLQNTFATGILPLPLILPRNERRASITTWLYSTQQRSWFGSSTLWKNPVCLTDRRLLSNLFQSFVFSFVFGAFTRRLVSYTLFSVFQSFFPFYIFSFLLLTFNR